VLITGASGLIGSELIRKLSSDYSSIFAIYSQNMSIHRNNIKWIKMDLRRLDYDILVKEVGHIDVLIHNAASKSICATEDEEKDLEAVNIVASRKLFDAAIKMGVSKIIFTSGFNILSKPLPSVVDESAETNPLTPYACSKLVVEEYLEDICAKHGISHLILRISSPVHYELAKMPNTIVRNWIESSQRGEVIRVYGNGGRSQDFVSVKDIARAFISAISTKKSGVFNIGSGTTLSMISLAILITDYFQNEYEYFGHDENEDDHWNISIEKARRFLKYDPIYSSTGSINVLLESVSHENSHS